MHHHWRERQQHLHMYFNGGAILIITLSVVGANDDASMVEQLDNHGYDDKNDDDHADNRHMYGHNRRSSLNGAAAHHPSKSP